MLSSRIVTNFQLLNLGPDFFYKIDWVTWLRFESWIRLRQFLLPCDHLAKLSKFEKCQLSSLKILPGRIFILSKNSFHFVDLIRFAESSHNNHFSLSLSQDIMRIDSKESVIKQIYPSWIRTYGNTKQGVLVVELLSKQATSFPKQNQTIDQYT